MTITKLGYLLSLHLTSLNVNLNALGVMCVDFEMNLLYAVEQAQTHMGQVLSNRQVQLCLNGGGGTPGKLFPGRTAAPATL